MLADALRHGCHGSGRRRELGHRQTRLAHDVVDELLALVLAAFVAHKVLRLDLETHATTGPLLGSRDGLAEHLLARGVSTGRADVERQVHAHVGKIGEDGEPRLARDIAHAGKHDFVLARDALEGTRTGDVGRLVSGRRASHGVVNLLGLQARAHERLRGTRCHAQAALAAAVEHVDGAVLDLDGVNGAHVDARAAAALVGLAGQAWNAVHTRTFLVIRRVPMRLGIVHRADQRVGNAAERVLSASMPLLISIMSSNMSRC